MSCTTSFRTNLPRVGWLPPHAAYDMTAAPSTEHLTVGQLSDDVQEVAALGAATDP
ncbi:hypothetical protein SAMN05660485_03299 [Blastococcus fimeti]|nr:hypothetical protein SAMN05660485_03299 [Blastococcus fimeti]